MNWTRLTNRKTKGFLNRRSDVRSIARCGSLVVRFLFGDNGHCNSEHWASREPTSCAIQKVCHKQDRSLAQNHFLCAVCVASRFIVLAGEYANSLGFWRSTEPKDRGAWRRQTCDSSRADDRIARKNHNSALACATGSLYCCFDATVRRRVARGGLRSRLSLCRVDARRCAVAS